MGRSIWKGNFINSKFLFLLYNFSKCIDEEKRKFRVRVWSRNSVILPFLIGSTVEVYNGRIFVPLTVSKLMVGKKYGDFVFTKKMGISIHNNSISNKLVKKKK